MRRRARALLVFGLCALPTTANATELELVLRGGAFIPSDGEGALDPLGVQGGATALLRLGDHFALGGMIDVARIGWNAAGSSDGVVVEGLGFPDPDGARRRVRSSFEEPSHPDCGDGAGLSGQLGLRLDWSSVLPNRATRSSLAGTVAEEPCKPCMLDAADVIVDGVRHRYLVVAESASRRLQLLSGAERDVALRAAKGQSNQAIADARGASVHTIANQLRSVFCKLGVASRHELTTEVLG
jgi:DNA-binding CsgD family transcriptional regulator